MSKQFFAELAGHDAPLKSLGIAETENPFLTDSYISALQMLDRECWIVGTRDDRSVADAAIAVLSRGRLSTVLEIPSLPASAATELFWDGVYELNKKLRVTDLVAETFASLSFQLPPLKGEISRTERTEYVVRLDGDLASRLSSNHKRNVKKAKAAGVSMRHGADPQESLSQHQRLMAQSLDRRSARGESVVPSAQASPEHRAFLQAGAAQLFQALQGDAVVSSVLVLLSREGAYYESAGTSPEGMAVGASHFLINSIGEHLREQGYRSFNLGGALPGSSLARFKAGFGTTEVPLSACTCYVGAAWRRKIRTAYTLARENPAQLRKAICGDRYTLLVYAIGTDAILKPVPVSEGMRFAGLSDQELINLPADSHDPEFRERQLERLRRFGRSYAFAVIDSEAIAHVSWLLPPKAVDLESPRILLLRPDEAEITACETLPQFRGKNMYPFAVQQLLRVAGEQGIRRVYMKTQKSNLPSQAGILKAGLKAIGAITVVTPPGMPGKSFVFRRLHS